MTVLLVGADRLGNIPHELKNHGCTEIIHWTGRKERTRPIPERVEMVLVIHDFVNHGLMDSVKTQARRRRLPIFFAKRGIAGLKQALAEQGQ